MPTNSSPSEELREFAEDPAAWGEIDPRTGLERVLTDRYCLLLGDGFTQVSRLRLDPDDVAAALHEVREQVASLARKRVTWNVGSSATPSDLVDRLVAHGLVAKDHLGALVATADPPAAPAGVEARRVRDAEEFALAESIGARVFHGGEPQQNVEERYARELGDRGARTYLAFVDGVPVGAARMFVQPGDPAAVLVSGGVLEHARGRGAYRALVRARWDDAVAAGFEALTVQAGPMSRPILERVGFRCVAEIEVLLDPTTC
ncbi:MAG TPA: GNAT family N-acetyltransferase [Gaiellaceae bacterium]|nr:GNAT family N-acetyltransferase [Gaiellaceae bacterium]